MTMPTPTDIRAALRDAANALARIGLRRDAELIASLRTLADAPPTVAELLPVVDATHEVHWEAHGEERRICHDGCYGVEWRTVGGSKWRECGLTQSDLTAPARLVEVSP